MNDPKCPPQQRLADFTSGKLPEDEALQVTQHVAECQACEATLESLDASSDTLSTGLREAPPQEPYVEEPGYQQAVDKLNKLPEAGKSKSSPPKPAEPKPAEPAAPAAEQKPSATTPAPKTAPKAPPKLGPYKLLAKLGEGGMGAVYKALHEHLEKVVAVKVLPKKAMQDPAAVARFRREMKAVGQLHHPNIVGAHDAGEAGGIHFLVMEYVDGQDLSSLLKKQGPLALDKVVSYMLQAARGLAFAHGKGIVHRDVKPANLLVDSDGMLKILDMGLARLDNADPSAAAQEGLTQTGQVMGTVDYMAPEQAFDTHRADAKADVYSLGCTMYRLLTGTNAFTGDTLVQKILAHREHPIPSLRAARADVPIQLDELYERMMAKRPENRPTMAEAAAALETIKAAEAPSTLTMPSPLSTQVDEDGMTAAHGHQQLRSLAQALDSTPSAENAVAQKEVPGGRKKKTQAKGAGGGKKPPLKLLLGAAGAALAALLGVWIVVRGPNDEVVSKTHVADNQRVEILPDGPLPAVDRKSQIVDSRIPRTPLADGAIGGFTRLALEKNAISARFAVIPDGWHVAVFTDYHVRLYELATGRTVWDRPLPASPYAQALVVSPDGQTLALAGTQGMPGKGVVYLLRTSDGTITKTLDFEPLGYSAAFSGDNRLLAVGTKSGLIQLVDAATGSAVRTLSGHKTSVNGLAFSPDGTRLASAAAGGTAPGDTKLRMWDVAAGSEITLLKQVPNISFAAVSFSPDGSRLLAGSGNASAELWNPLSDEHIGRIDNPRPDTMYGVKILPSGRRALCRSTALLLADLSSLKILQELGELSPNDPGLRDLGVTPDGRFAITWCAKEDYLRIWPLPPECWAPGTDLKSRLADSSVPPTALTDINDPAFQQWVKATQALPAEQQIEAVSKKLMELNPGFDGKLNGANENGPPDLRKGVVSVVRIHSIENLTDLSPLRAFRGMTEFVCNGDLGHRGVVSDLAPLQGMPLVGLSVTGQLISDLSPLSGMKLQALKIGRTDVNDLSPLRGMPLTQLECYDTPITDLSPCDGLPLTFISFTPKSITQGLEVLRRMNSLKTIGVHKGVTIERFTSAEFWKKYDAGEFGKLATPARLAYLDPAFQQWVKATQALPADQQIEAVSKKLMERNPGFGGRVTGYGGKGPPKIENGVVTELGFVTFHITDISPVRALAGLKALNCDCDSGRIGALTDLSPLHGLNLRILQLNSTAVSDLTPLAGMPLADLSLGGTKVSDLSALEGMPLAYLGLYNTKVSNLSPLKGAPMTTLKCAGTQVSDLSPLRGMKLTDLDCMATAVSDLSPLEGMQLTFLQFTPKRITKGLDVVRQINSLKTIAVSNSERLPTADFWKQYDAGDFGKPIAPVKLAYLDPAFQQWVKATQALPAEQQIEAVSKKLMELNPGFDGKVTGAGNEGKGTPKIENDIVRELGIWSDDVIDLSPLRAFAGLRYLVCVGSKLGQGKLSDLSPLKGLPLTRLHCSSTQVSDLSPLEGMKLTHLECVNTKLSDLSPLKGMLLTSLSFDGTQVAELSPLQGMPLNSLVCTSTQVSDLSPLRGMPLEYLYCAKTQVADLSPLKGTPLTILDCFGTQVSDLTPLITIPTLTGFKAARTKVTPAGVAELQEALPNCQIEWDDSGKGNKPLTDINDPAFQKWMRDVATLKPDDQAAAVVKKLEEINPGFRAKIAAGVSDPLWGTAGGVMSGKDENGAVNYLSFYSEEVSDLAPVRALPKLSRLNCMGGHLKAGTKNLGKSKLSRLASLGGLPLTLLSIRYTQVSDLTELQGMPLAELDCDHTPVNDLAQIAGLPLTVLRCGSTNIQTLAPLKGMKLTLLEISTTDVADLSPLAGMPLRSLVIGSTKVADLTPLRGMPLEELLAYNNPQITDAAIAPLKELRSLKHLAIQGTRITPAGVTALQNALPNCKIDWDDPAKAAPTGQGPTP